MTPDVLVVCLCAAWCRVCDEYRLAFDAAKPSLGARFRCLWVDIEEHEDALGDLDIENFPSLLIVRGHAPVFFGTVAPQPQHLLRMARAAADGDLAPVGDFEVLRAARALLGLADRTQD
jgi:hypothetical protein